MKSGAFYGARIYPTTATYSIVDLSKLSGLQVHSKTAQYTVLSATFNDTDDFGNPTSNSSWFKGLNVKLNVGSTNSFGALNNWSIPKTMTVSELSNYSGQDGEQIIEQDTGTMVFDMQDSWQCNFFDHDGASALRTALLNNGYTIQNP